jgi:7-carboxy-7-deazaguanine synthase
MLKINEIYASIQGESSHTGLPCVFIRLTGCNLRCSWCDTAYSFYEGNDLTIEETLQKVETFGLPLVEITGGEPLLQENVYPLMEALLKKGYRVMLETGGALPIDKDPERVIKILDIKCPGSGEEKKNHLENLKFCPRMMKSSSSFLIALTMNGAVTCCKNTTYPPHKFYFLRFMTSST